jgi:hypothetical protein
LRLFFSGTGLRGGVGYRLPPENWLLRADVMPTRYPFWSVDSSSWAKVGVYGNIVMPQKRGGRFDFGVPPRTVSASEDAAKSRGYGTLPADMQAEAREWLAEIGVPLGRTEAGVTLELGVSSWHGHSWRKVANLHYYERLRASLPEYPWPFKPAAAAGSTTTVSSPAGTRRLLILGCSARKVTTAGPLPALERYAGGAFQVVKKLMRLGQFPADVDLRIVSAKHGLLRPDEPIQDYDLRLTPDRAKGQAGGNAGKLRALVADGNYREVLISAGRAYLAALGQPDAWRGSAAVTVNGGAIGVQLQKLRAWLLQPPPQRSVSMARRRAKG